MNEFDKIQYYKEILAKYIAESDNIYHSGYMNDEYYARPLGCLIDKNQFTYPDFLVENCEHSLVRSKCLYGMSISSDWCERTLPFSYYKKISEKLKNRPQDLRQFIKNFYRYIGYITISEEDRILFTNDVVRCNCNMITDNVTVDMFMPQEGRNISDEMFKYFFIDNSNINFEYLLGVETRKSIKISKETLDKYLESCSTISMVPIFSRMMGPFEHDEAAALLKNTHFSNKDINAILNYIKFDFLKLNREYQNRVITCCTIDTKDEILVHIIEAAAEATIDSEYQDRYFYDREDAWFEIIKQKYIEGKISQEILYKFCQNPNITTLLRIRVTSLIGEKFRNWKFLLDMIKLNYATSSRSMGINNIFKMPLNPAAAECVVYDLVKNYPFLVRETVGTDVLNMIGFTSDLNKIYQRCGYSSQFIYYMMPTVSNSNG